MSFAIVSRCKCAIRWIYPAEQPLGGSMTLAGAVPMPISKTPEKDYDDIPGTYVFDADRSRRGYHLNMFCMSLMKVENRKAFKENEPKYLDERFPQLTPEQREAILKRQ